MKYNKIPQNKIAEIIASNILEHLNQNKKVLWMMTGGSGSKICFEIANIINKYDLSNLYVTMSDERYGDKNHEFENYKGLLDLGLNLGNANLYRILDNKSQEETTKDFIEWLDKIDQLVNIKIINLGLGEDGHIAGLKPQSSPTISSDKVAHYQGTDFYRVSISAEYLKTFDYLYLQAYGNNKHKIINDLLNNQNKNLEIFDYPYSILYQTKNLEVYSDFEN